LLWGSRDCCRKIRRINEKTEIEAGGTGPLGSKKQIEQLILVHLVHHDIASANAEIIRELVETNVWFNLQD
jgi:hypothetical protein